MSWTDGIRRERNQHHGSDHYVCDLGGDLLHRCLYHGGGTHDGRDQKNRVTAEVVEGLRGDERDTARTEQTAHVTGDAAKAVGVEDHKADDHNKQKIYAGGTSRYITTKNRKNTPDRLELKKYNPILKKYTVHKEIK